VGRKTTLPAEGG